VTTPSPPRRHRRGRADPISTNFKFKASTIKAATAGIANRKFMALYNIGDRRNSEEDVHGLI